MTKMNLWFQAVNSCRNAFELNINYFKEEHCMGGIEMGSD